MNSKMNPPQVHLRALEPEDLDLLYKIENDVKLWNVGTSNVPYSRYTLHNYVATASNDIYTDRQVRMIIENEAGQTIGIVDVVNFDPSNQRAEVGLVILSAYRCQGYAAATLTLIADYALHIWHLHQLFAFIDVSNQASVSLFMKMGFQKSACITDWLYDGQEYHDAWLVQLVI